MKFTLPSSAGLPSSSSSTEPTPSTKLPRLRRKPKPLSPTSGYKSGFEISRPKSSPSTFLESPSRTAFRDEPDVKHLPLRPKSRELPPLPPPSPHAPIPVSPVSKLSALIISPDLDALLAHDELMRRRQNRAQTESRSPRTPPPPRSPQSPRSQSSVGSLSPVTPWSGPTHTPNTSFGSFKAFVHSPIASSWGSLSGGIPRVIEEEESGEPVLQSLLAPPAKRRNGRRATFGGDEKSARNLPPPPPPPPSPALTNVSHVSSFLEMENPYINPAPSIEDVLKMRTAELNEHPMRQTGNQPSTHVQHQIHIVAHRGSHLSGENATTEAYKSEQSLLSLPNYSSKNKSRGKLVKEKSRGKQSSVPTNSDIPDAEVRVQPDGYPISISHSSPTSRIYPQEILLHTQQKQLHYSNLEKMGTTSIDEPWRQPPQPGSRQTVSHASTHSHSKSTTLSDYHFVDEDPYSPPPGSTSFSRTDSVEDAARISISSTAYPATEGNDSIDDEYNDYFNAEDFEVIPTPRSPTRPTVAASAEDRISFIELSSPTFTPEDDPRGRPNMSFRDRSPNGSTSSSKPPIPTTPKPDFTTPHLKSSSRRKSKSKKKSSSRTEAAAMAELPPTTNHLAAEERADLVRKSRKLTRVFGQTPRGSIISPGAHNSSPGDSPSGHSFLDISPTRHRSAFSIASSIEVRPHTQQSSTYTYTTPPKAVWPPPSSGTQYLTAGGRRHSTPLTPDEFEFLSNLHQRDDVDTLRHKKSTLHEAGSDDGYEREQEEEEADLIEVGTQEGEPRASTSIGHDFYAYTYGQLAVNSPPASRRASAKGAPAASPSVMSFMDLSDGSEDATRALGKAVVGDSGRRGDVDENSDTKVARSATNKMSSNKTGTDSDPGTGARTGASSIVSVGVTRNTHPTELTELEPRLSDSPAKRTRIRKLSDSSSSVLSGRTSSTSLSSIAFAPTSPYPNSLGFAPNTRSGSGTETGSGSRLPVVPSNFDSYSSSTSPLQHKYSVEDFLDKLVLPPTSLPGPSLYRSLSLLSLTPEELADEEKRRKREKLAKLHRFLGSRVPANLVLGIEDAAYTLPPEMDVSNSASGSGDEKKVWLRRRRSNSSGALGGAGWSDAVDRVKDDLGDEERMVNVRRAVKMEKVFGVAPPQTLYHTRGHAPSASVSAANLLSSKTSPSLGFVPPKMLRSSSGDGYLSSTKASPSSCLPPPSSGNDMNKGSGQKSSSSKSKRQKDQRPGTADSTKELLPKVDTESTGSGNGKGLESMVRNAGGASLVYTHYQHSLNSLNDILDRDDRESLAELHDYLNNTDLDANLDFGLGHLDLNNVDVDLAPLSPGMPPSTMISSTIVTGRDRAMSSTSIRSERRRSLPARTSSISLSSQSIKSFDFDTATPTTAAITGVPSPDAKSTAFQARRKRAAKLTQFFGVNYRDLIRDVLEGIENGLEHERSRGTIGVEEAEDLLQKLRTLKTKRDGLV